MKLLTTIRELFQHMEWADALVWQTVAASEAAIEDEVLRARLLHIHEAQRAFLRIWQERPLNPNAGNDLGGAALAASWREYHQEVAQYLSEISEADLDRPVKLPWAEFMAARIGRQPETPTLGETLLQVASHSGYHRGQVNTRLRELGAEPPLVDFIAWIWVGKPAAQWTRHYG
jgi:uncharacterized damage-inducible protein DinB